MVELRAGNPEVRGAIILFQYFPILFQECKLQQSCILLFPILLLPVPKSLDLKINQTMLLFTDKALQLIYELQNGILSN